MPSILSPRAIAVILPDTRTQGAEQLAIVGDERSITNDDCRSPLTDDPAQKRIQVSETQRVDI